MVIEFFKALSHEISKLDKEEKFDLVAWYAIVLIGTPLLSMLVIHWFSPLINMI